MTTSTTPVAGAVWTAARSAPGGRRVLHLVDLRGQPDDHWDQPKVRARPARGLVLEWPGLRDPHAATPWDRRGAAIRLRPLGPSGTSGAWRLPTFRRWLLVAEREARTAHHLDD